jgi:hypothetical protein
MEIKATKTAAIVKEIVPAKITLELSEKDAKTLGAMLGAMSGIDIKGFVEKHRQFVFDIAAEDVDKNIGLNIYNALRDVVGRYGDQ